MYEPRRMSLAALVSVAVLLCYCALLQGADADKVTTLRVPDRGIQPQVAVDGNGILHMIYFKGTDAGAGDVFYVHSDDGGKKFSKALQVNSQAGSVIAIGNIRGAQLAIGKKGRVHVSWLGSSKAEPKAPGKATPMLYTRLNDDGTAFEPQRNLIQSAVGLDGGGSVAADEAGNVYVAWHAPEPGKTGEENRRVWVAYSKDEGKTFAKEKMASSEKTGACGCCGMRAFADRKGTLYMLFRSAERGVNRDTYLITSKNQCDSFDSDRIDKWNVGQCPMSSFTLTESGGSVLSAWETDGKVFFSRIDPATGKRSDPIAAPGGDKVRKHPVVAVNEKGETILVWTEGMGWERGGALAWQVYDKDGKPTDQKGRADGVPTWSLVAVFVRADGGFTVVY
jgi:hypothetical protein